MNDYLNELCNKAAIPTIMSNDATIFPPTVTGYKSPYPMVVTVAIGHQKASPILVNLAYVLVFNKELSVPSF
jgi:hypothetical protein